MNALGWVGRMALALFCFVFAGWSAPITYPNQAFIVSEIASEPLPGALNVKAVAIENSIVLAVTRDGRVLGYGVPETWLEEGILEVTNVVSVGVNYTMAAALTADGRVIEFGRPNFQPPGLTNVIALDLSGQNDDDDLDYKLAVTRDGRVVVWGYFIYPPDAEVPGVVTASGGWSHIVALKSDRTVVEWSLYEQPRPVAGLSNVVAVAAGGTHNLALKADGTVVAWGANYFGQAIVPTGISNVAAIAASEYSSLALMSNGTVTAWGPGYVNVLTNLPNVIAIACSGMRNVAIVGPPKECRIICFRVDGQSVTVCWRSVPGRTYYIDYKPTLTTQNWTPVSGGIIAQGMVMTWSGIRPSGDSAFYRVVMLGD